MALAVCLLFDERSERALRALWNRLEKSGVATLATHTHRRHVPHLSYAVLRAWDLPAVGAALAQLPDGGPLELRFDGLGAFRRGRTWLVPSVTSELVRRQEAVAGAVAGTGADLHHHYRPGVWTPHCTLAPRIGLDELATVAAAVYDILPVTAHAERAALVDSGTGTVHTLGAIP